MSELPHPALGARAGLMPHADRIPIWFGVLVVSALWMLARPYVGLRHDGVIYLGQALRHLQPETMSRDLFFAYGSQDSFTVFGRLLAWLYSRWEIADVQIAVLAVCQLAMLAVLLQLLQTLATDFERWLGLAAIAVMSHVYGGFGLLSFAERFVTARSPAEPVALLALLLLMQRRLVPAGLLLLLAGLIHPLMTLPVVVVCWLILLFEDRRWCWAGLLVLIPLALGVAQVPPFDALFLRFDDEWWRPVSRVNAMVLVLGWGLADWQVVGFDLSILLLGTRWLKKPLARLCLATAIATAGLLLLSAVGADLLRNVLITQLQGWRAMWVTHVLVLALLPALILHAWRLEAGGRLFALALAAAAVAVNGRWPAGWVFIAWAGVTYRLASNHTRLSPEFLRATMLLTSAALVLLSLAVMGSVINQLSAANMALDLPMGLLILFTMPTFAMPLAAGLLYGWGCALRSWAIGSVALTVCVAVYGAAHWDRRSAWTQYIERGLHRSHPFNELIPPKSLVYWDESVAATWVLLKRASFMSGEQGAGVLFNRRTAVEMVRRAHILDALEMQRKVCSITSALDIKPADGAACMPTLEVAQAICRAPAGPDFMVFQRQLSSGMVSQWSFESPGSPNQTFYLYDCLKLR